MQYDIDPYCFSPLGDKEHEIYTACWVPSHVNIYLQYKECKALVAI